MDHTLNLSDTSVAGLPATANSLSGAAATADEDPESPGRSPGGSAAAASLPDPLADGLAVLAGVAIALTAVVVPLTTVLLESRLQVPGITAARTER